NCIAGRHAMIDFCKTHGIRHEICGKVLVATESAELPRLKELHQRAQANGVDCELIDSARLHEIEPHVTGLRALWVPGAGIADFGAVATRLATLIQEGGGQIHVNARVHGMREETDRVTIVTSAGEFQATRAINCAGLHSDRVAKLSGMKPTARIVPFRGEYHRFKATSPRLCNNLIYPVPNPALPFLGVHLTRMVDGTIEVGPNAVLAFAREGYKKTDLNISDLFGTLTYPGFLRLAMSHWRTGVGEVWRSLSRRAFVRALQRLVPDLRADYLEPAPAGVRAQAVGADGSLVDDFLIEESNRVLHVCNAPSPGATAALNIGANLAEIFDP
ncbi:MAG: L-2-hydroxyglutarate oxidase, partial [Planctomycetota bacterium]|nr:L-2-hydroxyglutarate oxidase [Planctomycetota bacterium]